MGRLRYTDYEVHSFHGGTGLDELVESCTGNSRKGIKRKFHSVLGDREKLRNTYKEIMVYDDDQVYPDYALMYKRVYK